MPDVKTTSPSRPTTIALDAMGGDHGASVVVPAAIQYLDMTDEVNLILVGQQDVLHAALDGFSSPRLSVRHASQTVAMDESPTRALRGKKDSSMRVAINLVKDGSADACVSAGNTGALMATARFVLKMLPHIERPAIITAIPSTSGHTWVLDLGANVDCTANHLFQFAVMGSELVSVVDDLPSPRVGLLNIGQEEIKGNEQVKGAHAILGQSSLNYIGYVEGDDIYTGDVDVVVTDGFVGNVALKASEGVASLVRHQLKKGFTSSLLGRLRGLVAMPVLKAFQKSMDPRRYNGASLLGLRGIVIKSHGSADVLAFTNALKIAREEVEKDIGARITYQVESQLAGGE